MNASLERFGLRVMSGEANGPAARIVRGALGLAEPIYAAAMTARNGLYDAGIFRAHRLPKPTISVGNLTAGGTGKTPVIRFLAEHLLARGRQPAVLLRGYRSTNGTQGDEQQLLHAQLNRELRGAPVMVVADPDRRAGAEAALKQQPRTDVFLLDDAFQHRKVARDFDLVLIDATEPFGYEHVHPRGLLREPMRGLRRADAILVTRANVVEHVRLEAIEADLRSIHTTSPVYRAEHALVGLRDTDDNAEPMSWLRGRRFFAFAGIGSPQSFQAQLVAAGGEPVGKHWFSDHHAYTPRDLAELSREATSARSEMMLTTEKDWVKLRHLAEVHAVTPPIARVEMRIYFQHGADETALLDAIERRITARDASS